MWLCTKFYRVPHRLVHKRFLYEKHSNCVIWIWIISITLKSQSLWIEDTEFKLSIAFSHQSCLMWFQLIQLIHIIKRLTKPIPNFAQQYFGRDTFLKIFLPLIPQEKFLVKKRKLSILIICLNCHARLNMCVSFERY